MGNVPLITIVLACFREGDFLLECWNSVLAQSDSRWEAVLVKDGGASAETTKAFHTLDHPNLRKVELKENIGPYPVRSKGIEMARTEFILPLDADDLLPPNSIHDILEAFLASGADYLYGKMKIFGNLDVVLDFPEQVSISDIVRESCPYHTVFRKTVYDRVGGYSHELARGNADVDFLLSLVEMDAKSARIGSVYYHHRHHSESQVSQSYQTEYYAKRLCMVRRHPVLFGSFWHRMIFLGNGAYYSAIGLADAGRSWAARCFAFRALFSLKTLEPSCWYILLTGQPLQGKLYQLLKQIFRPFRRQSGCR